jgi:hypothetical protein
MASTDLACRDELRRGAARRAGLNGLDFLEVSDDQRTLSVWFVGPAPELRAANVRIEGGRRVTGLVVTGVQRCGEDDPELDKCVRIFVDRPGDFSTYVLKLVEADERGRPTEEPLAGFDPRYAQLAFSFKVNCPSDLDCAEVDRCPPTVLDEPEISYLAKDYASFRQLIYDRLSLVMPAWTERHVPDLGVTLVELLAYVGDYLSYYQDAVATEAYLETARLRISVRRHVRLIGYAMHDGCNARAWVCVETSRPLALQADDVAFLAPRKARTGPLVLRAQDVDRSAGEAFEPLDRGTIRLEPAHNAIRLWTWGDEECCLPAGATRATLVDGTMGEDGPQRALHLAPGDVLVFEEVLGGRTGVGADADPAHRQAVRLTAVTELVDEVCAQPVLDVEWAREDALSFALCLSILDPEDCCPLHDVSVARGNVVLVDHGRTLTACGGEREPLPWPPADPGDPSCEAIGRPADPVARPVVHEPVLAQWPVTQRGPSPSGPARDALGQDPHLALPVVDLVTEGASDETWTARRDLLDSGPDDRDVVGEVDDEGRLHLRFGDDDAGRAVDPGSVLLASYRVGNGSAGNLGAGAISRIVFCGPPPAGIVRVRNPLPAVGATEPEALARVKALAPGSATQELRRAITTADYAELAGRVPGLQRAAAELRWNGSWHEVHVGLDPLGTQEADAALRERVAAALEPVRRIGHDVSIHDAEHVALDLGLLVCVAPHALRGQVRAALLGALGSATLPDGSLGLFHPDRLSFGGGVRLSRIVAAAEAVAGVQSAQVTRLERLFEGDAGELDAGILRLGALEIAELDNDPGRPESGRLTLDLRGGR